MSGEMRYILLLVVIVFAWLVWFSHFIYVTEVKAGERLDINLEPIGNLIDGEPGVVDFGEIARQDKIDEITDRLHYEVTTTPIYEDDLRHQELLDAIEEQLGE